MDRVKERKTQIDAVNPVMDKKYRGDASSEGIIKNIYISLKEKKDYILYVKNVFFRKVFRNLLEL